MMFAGAIQRDCVGNGFVSFSAFDFRVVGFSAFGSCLQARMQLRSSTCSTTARSSRSMALMRAPWCSRAPSASECGGCGPQWLPRLQWGPMVILALLATGRPVRSLLEEAADWVRCSWSEDPGDLRNKRVWWHEAHLDRNIPSACW